MSTVDQSLARGAARTALRDLMEESARAIRSDNLQIKAKGRKARNQIVDAYLHRMKPLALHIAHESDVGYGGGVAAIALGTFQKQSAKIEHGVVWGVRNANLVQSLQGARIEITEHALQRINQRLALLDVKGVREAFRPASFMLVFIAYGLATEYKDARQLSIPFFGGAFRCDVPRGAAILIRTFVPEPTRREAELISDLSAIEASITRADSELLLWLPYAAYNAQHKIYDSFSKAVLKRQIETSEALATILRKYSWITEPYAERSDPTGAAWDDARAAHERGE